MRASFESMDVLASIPVTAVVFAVVSLAAYYCFLKPLLTPTAHPRPGPSHGTRQQNRGRVYLERDDVPARRRSNEANDSEVLTLLANNTRMPPHMAPASSGKLDRGGIGLLSEGLLPYRYSRAAAYEQALDPDVIATNRLERARVISRILSMTESDANAPPQVCGRGSTVVIAIPSSDVGCPKLCRALYLLSTYLNVLLVLHVEGNMTDGQIDQLVGKLRGDNIDDLPEDVLPRHRIVASQSITGRIAFVRQLSRVEFVLDFDNEVSEQLDRFGIRVFVYGQDLTNKNESLLGNALL